MPSPTVTQRPIASCSPLLTATLLLTLAACNQPPEGLAISLQPSEPHTLDDLNVVIGTDAVDPNGKDVVTYRYRWTVDGSVMEDITEGTVSSGSTLKGQLWEVTVVPWDDKLGGTAAVASVTVLNSAPTVTVSASPANPKTLDKITLEVETADNDRDAVSLRYAWSLNGSVTSLTADTLQPNRTHKGEVWEVAVYPTDDEVEGEPATATVTIGNTPPSATKATVVSTPSPATSGSTLSCQGSGWNDVDEDPEGYTVAWYVNGAQVGSDAQLAGKFTRGDSVNCVLTPFDGDDSGTPVTSAAVIIRNAAPVLQSVTISPEDPKDGVSVTSALGPATDSDGDDVSFRYSWRINGRESGTASDLPSSRFKRDDEIVL